ncbi:ROK family transcriptional regulator [Actinomycetaceae bacterium MB13-C1-2]|nr:ROK family transcriptional regulator [Actinomycetaceae bacterium MB13-C1-2]
MSVGPGSQTSLREANAVRVAETVKKYGRITQVELAAATGLSAASISNIVKRLAADGILQVENTVRSGRRASLVSLVRPSGLLAGIHVGTRGATVAISDLALKIEERIALPLPISHRADTTLDRVALMTAELVERMGATPDELLAVGVAIPEPIDPETGMPPIPGILPGWEDTRVDEVLSSRLNRPVSVENDANAAALAEARIGGLRGVPAGIFVRASFNTGAGITIDGDIYRGIRGIAGEIGHIQVDPGGLICQCGGRGCLNTVVGAAVLTESLRLSRGELTLADLISLAEEGDVGCRQVISDAGAKIGKVVADTAVVIPATKVIVGGELAATGETLIAPIREALTNRPILMGAVGVEASTLGADAELYGALILARQVVETSAMPTGGNEAALSDVVIGVGK